MCKRTFYFMSLISAAVIISGTVWTQAGDGGADFGAGPGFGKRIAGTYFSNAGFGGTITLHADGTVVALSGQCCGNAPNIQSESYGNWVKTGPMQIELRTVAIGTNWGIDVLAEGQGSDTTLSTAPTGNFIATPSEVLDFAEDFQSYTGTLCTPLWFYDLGFGQMPNILVEEPQLVFGPFPVGGTRLPVEVVCP